MKLTTNYSLKMPEGSDVVNIEDLNYNANVIDNTLLQNKNDILNIVEVTNSMGSEIEVLKDKVSSLDTPKKVENFDITFLNGWFNKTNITTRCIDKVVYINFVMGMGSVAYRTPILKIPKKYAPLNGHAFYMYTYQGAIHGLYLASDGSVILDNNNTVSNANDWFAIDVCYILD